MQAYTIFAAFLMGAAGSLHCAGMCGPIVLIVPFRHLHGFKKAAALLLYHFGRISTYCGLALLLFFFKGFFNPRVQQYLSVGLGGALLLAGMLYFAGKRAGTPASIQKFLSSAFSRVAAMRSPGAFFLSGILNGVLPCGIVYMALAATMVFNYSGQVIMYMYAFGLGTLPMLLGISLMQIHARSLNLGTFRRAAPYLVMLFGCLIILRGLNLGIPYVSPKLQVQGGAPVATCAPGTVQH